MNEQIELTKKGNKKRKYKPTVKEGKKRGIKKANQEKYSDLPIDSDDDTEWVVEYILDIREGETDTEYLIKWKGFEAVDASWEPLANCVNAKTKIVDFHKEKDLYCYDCGFMGPTHKSVKMHRVKKKHNATALSMY